jgi:phosphohistidine swiveling domain-containing protein
LILKEICHRTGITLGEIKYLSPREVSLVFKTKINRKLLQQRVKACVFYWDLNGHEAVVGADYKKVMSEILGNQKLSDVDDFRGLTASMGKARGRVKILHSAKEVSKVEPGDILVAVMTRPDYVPAMKRAAAIITDEGGVTCHAAIISRELKIPCIIGTKIATKVLKDGMEVEVNANHSWVKIIK